MKCALKSFEFPAKALCALFVIAAAVELPAQITFTPDFSNANNANLQLNGQGTVHDEIGTPSPVPATVAMLVTTTDGKVLRLTSSGQTHVAGSAWFTTLQSVSGGFTTVFKFRVTGGSADGFAFVIQNAFSEGGPSGINAIGAGGGALGYGQGNNNGGEAGNSMPGSLAVEFDTVQNVWGDPDNNHVAVQSCGENNNNQFHTNVDASFNPTDGTPAFTSCTLSFDDGSSAVLSLSPGTTIADGGVHTVTLDYEPPSCSECFDSFLDVNVDGTDVFLGGVSADLNNLGLNNGKAFVGFTGGTGDATANQDILSWTFTPHTTMTIGPLHTTAGQTTVFNFGAFNFKSTPANTISLQGDDLTVTARPIPSGTAIPFAGGNGTCITYLNTGGTCWVFDVVCTGPDCGGTYDSEFATSYDADLPINSPGFGKGEFAFPNPFTGFPEGDVFKNQIDAFFVQRIDPTTKAKSGGTPSLWVATKDTPGVQPNIFNFIGFIAPVQNTAINLTTAGQTVPLGFQVLNQNGNPVSNLTLCTQLNPASCPAGSVDIQDFLSTCSVDSDTELNAATESAFAGTSGLQNLGVGNYLFNWKTSKSSSKTCRTVQVNLLDGVNHIAVFKFK